MGRRRERLPRVLQLLRVPPRNLQYREYFSLRELQNEEALEIPLSYEVFLKPLENEIHPLFLRGHWSYEVNSNNSVWNTLDPVLRTASRFVSEDALMPFFYNLIFARKTLPESLAGCNCPLGHSLWVLL
jgi:hypothetical protein